MNELPFYITLPSDASMDQYPANTAAEWITKLKHSVTLKGKWEVALVEMQYVNSLSNLPSQQTMIIRTITGIREVDGKGQPEFADHAIVFPPGNYPTAQSFLRIIQHSLPDLQPVRFYYPPTADGNEIFAVNEEFCPETQDKAFKLEIFSETDHRLRITLGSPRVHIHFPSDSIILQKIFGFDQSDVYARMTSGKNPEHIDEIVDMYVKNKRITFKMEPVMAPRPLNPLLGNQSMFVYCDVADYSLVGDSASQILRSVPIKGAFMETVTERFDIPHYTPVLRTHFESLQIAIGTDLEETAKFATGKTLIKLHFRPARPF